MIDQLVPIKRARGSRLRGAESKQRSDFARTLVVAAATYVQGDARPLVADDVVEVEDLALLRRWRVPTPACPSAPARRCRRWSSRIRATRCCRPCSRSRPRPLPLGGRLPAGALLRVRIEGQLRWKVASWVSGRHGLTVDCVAAVVPSSSPGKQQRQGSSSSSPSQCATQVL